MQMMSISATNEPVHELAMEVRAHVVVDKTFLFLDLLGLVAEDSVFVPALGERVGGVNQRVALEKFALAVGHRLSVFLLSLPTALSTLCNSSFSRCSLIRSYSRSSSALSSSESDSDSECTLGFLRSSG
jgi:hypothetical protein